MCLSRPFTCRPVWVKWQSLPSKAQGFTAKGIVYAKDDVVTPDTLKWLGLHSDVPFRTST